MTLVLLSLGSDPPPMPERRAVKQAEQLAKAAEGRPGVEEGEEVG